MKNTSDGGIKDVLIRFGFALGLILVIILVGNLTKKTIKVEEVTIVDKQFINGLFSPNYSSIKSKPRWLIMTRDKTYQVDIRGTFAAPHIASSLKIGYKYRIETIGVYAPSYGEYPRITRIIEEL